MIIVFTFRLEFLSKYVRTIKWFLLFTSVGMLSFSRGKESGYEWNEIIL